MEKEKVKKILDTLEEMFPEAKPQLSFNSNFELLIAVILSAQCTDERVNIVTEDLFPLYNTPKKMLELGLLGLESKIRTCGLYHSKAQHLLETSAILCEKYDEEVPQSFEELVKLPGVGRKTANVLVSILFNIPAIAVDTHVFRVANRTELAVGKTPLDVELGLQKAIPKKWWSRAHHWLIWHGRRICKARTPLCDDCILNDLCPAAALKDS